MRPDLPRLHAVTTPSVLRRPDVGRRAAAIAVSPRVALHLRSPGEDGRRLLEVAALFRATEGVVFVNDRADVAALTRAAGLHLPTDGLPTSAARDLVGPDVWLGRSVHDVAEARAAASGGADYVFLGPIWATASHPDRQPLGPGAIERVRDIPVIAIGGVTPARVRCCTDAGAWGVASVRALWDAPDSGAAAAAMLVDLNGR